MEVLKCNNCGAKINRRTLQCDYCGTPYKKTSSGVAEEHRRQSSYIIPKLSREQILISMNHLKTSSWVLIAPIAFMSLWCSVACGAAISMLLTPEAAFMSFIPFIMTGIGLAVLIGLIRSFYQDSVNKIIKLVTIHETEKAYELAKKKGQKHQSPLLVSLLLAYHIFGDEEYLQQNAIRVTDTAIKSTTNYTNDYCVLVEKYTAIR